MKPYKSAPSPFHAGEQMLQAEVGKREALDTLGRRVIRDYLPDQHRTFYSQLPFLVVGNVDLAGRPWATLLTGPPGFVSAPDPQTLEVVVNPRVGDRVIDQFTENEAVGLLGIELPTRRRNRMNGRIASLHEDRLSVRVDQTFGNCPQYIQARDVEWRPGDFSHPRIVPFAGLPADAQGLIAAADTFFVASSAALADHPRSGGVDVSHRGGLPGFVRVEGDELTIPDFAGNNHFNTLGNFILNPRAGLVFVDFASGDLLQITGEVELLAADHPDIRNFRGAERGWRVRVAVGQWLRATLPLRFGGAAASPRNALTDRWTNGSAATV